jgi:hypothetical protein
MWTALDNAVFLFAPIRFVPGHGSAMHYSGRTVALLFLRLLLLAVLVMAAGGAAVLGHEVTQGWLGWSEGASRVVALVAAVLVAVAGVCGLVGAGGWMLRRYDVARERSLTG